MSIATPFGPTTTLGNGQVVMDPQDADMFRRERMDFIERTRVAEARAADAERRLAEALAQAPALHAQMGNLTLRALETDVSRQREAEDAERRAEEAEKQGAEAERLAKEAVRRLKESSRLAVEAERRLADAQAREVSFASEQREQRATTAEAIDLVARLRARVAELESSAARAPPPPPPAPPPSAGKELAAIRVLLSEQTKRANKLEKELAAKAKELEASVLEAGSLSARLEAQRAEHAEETEHCEGLQESYDQVASAVELNDYLAMTALYNTPGAASLYRALDKDWVAGYPIQSDQHLATMQESQAEYDRLASTFDPALARAFLSRGTGSVAQNTQAQALLNASARS